MRSPAERTEKFKQRHGATEFTRRLETRSLTSVRGGAPVAPRCARHESANRREYKWLTLFRATCIRAGCPIRPAGRSPAGHRLTLRAFLVALCLRCLNFSVLSAGLLFSNAVLSVARTPAVGVLITP
jgi:hypothetical protein